MTLDRFGRRGLAWLSLAALLSLVAVAACVAEAPAAPRSAQAKSEEIDAEMLRDLEVLNNPNYARDREIAKRLSFFERMRMLDQMTSNRPARSGVHDPCRAGQKGGEVTC